MLRPATDREFAVCIERLFEYAQTFGLSGQNVASAVRFYHEAMDGVPPDMVAEAVSRCTRNWKWGNRMPLPADLREHLPDEYWERRRAALNIDRAVLMRRR